MSSNTFFKGGSGWTVEKLSTIAWKKCCQKSLSGFSDTPTRSKTEKMKKKAHTRYWNFFRPFLLLLLCHRSTVSLEQDRKCAAIFWSKLMELMSNKMPTEIGHNPIFEPENNLQYSAFNYGEGGVITTCFCRKWKFWEEKNQRLYSLSYYWWHVSSPTYRSLCKQKCRAKKNGAKVSEKDFASCLQFIVTKISVNHYGRSFGKTPLYMERPTQERMLNFCNRQKSKNALLLFTLIWRPC